MALAPLALGSEAAASSSENAARIPALPECALEMLRNCSFDRFQPSQHAAPALPVDHAYVIHYTANVHRRAHQMRQLPKLGIRYSFVTGYDRDYIDRRNRACVLTSSPRLDLDLGGNKKLDMHKANPAYISQVIKLYAALYDMLASGHSSALILEDDAVIRGEGLPMLATAMKSLHGNYTIIYSGSYSPDGKDDLPYSLYPKDASHIPSYRGPGRMMPAVGCILSAAGAAHVLRWGLPIRAPVDMTLSDSRVKAAPRHRAFVFKPYAFTPAAFGNSSSSFGGEGIPSDVRPPPPPRALFSQSVVAWLTG